MYAPASVATCVQQSVGDPPTGNVHNVDECAGADYTPSTGGNWMMVGCFVSDQDGVSHADPWADGSRCALCSYNVLVTSVKISP
jgi:hypothetical protein